MLQISKETPNITVPALLLQYTNLTDRYYVECDRIYDPQLPGLNPSHCLLTVPQICTTLSQLGRATLLTQVWRWEAAIGPSPGCALGYYLPVEYKSHPEKLPSKDECERDIYGLIIERCAFRSQYNVGSINAERLPQGRQPGLPMTERYPRYIMAPDVF